MQEDGVWVRGLTKRWLKMEGKVYNHGKTKEWEDKIAIRRRKPRFFSNDSKWKEENS